MSKSVNKLMKSKKSKTNANQKLAKQRRSNGKKSEATASARINREAPRMLDPVSRITTAPVAIGNTMKGASARVVARTIDAVRIVGRDFAFPAQATGSVTGWVNVGGFPLTPAAFVSSILRSYTQMYNKFKFNKVAIHYITSSSTSSTGDVMFMINKNRSSPAPNNTASTFLSYVLSDENTILGPQWTNHTAVFDPTGPYRNLDYGSNSDIDYQSQGEVFLYSKTSTTDSPGYVIIDYDLSFKELSVNPKAGLLPNNNILFQPIQLVAAAGSMTATSGFIVSAGTRWVGNQVITALTSTTSFAVGDVYKIILDTTNSGVSTWTVTAGTTPTLANLVASLCMNLNVSVTLSDGFTCYLVFYSSTQAELVFTLEGIGGAATSASNTARYNLTATVPTYGESGGVPNAGIWLYGMASFICNIAGNRNQQQ